MNAVPIIALLVCNCHILTGNATGKSEVEEAVIGLMLFRCASLFVILTGRIIRVLGLIVDNV